MPYVPVGFWGRLVVHLLLYREEMIDVQIPRIIDQRGKVHALLDVVISEQSVLKLAQI